MQVQLQELQVQDDLCVLFVRGYERLLFLPFCFLYKDIKIVHKNIIIIIYFFCLSNFWWLFFINYSFLMKIIMTLCLLYKNFCIFFLLDIYLIHIHTSHSSHASSSSHHRFVFLWSIDDDSISSQEHSSSRNSIL